MPVLVLSKAKAALAALSAPLTTDGGDMHVQAADAMVD